MAIKRTKSRRKTQAQSGPRFPLWAIILGFGALLVAAGLIWSANSGGDYVPKVSGGPALEVDREKIDFGDVKLGDWVTASVEVTNVGDEPLRFTEKPYVELKEGC